MSAMENPDLATVDGKNYGGGAEKVPGRQEMVVDKWGVRLFISSHFITRILFTLSRPQSM